MSIFQLVSSKDPEKIYKVEFNAALGRFTCTCPDFIYRRKQVKNGRCKHIRYAVSEGGFTKNNDLDLDFVLERLYES